MDTLAPSEAGARPASPTAPRQPRVRDPRLDFYRGIGMGIILIAHIPGNTWTLWIPARFGFSDATEMFVFLSGMASAIAFGGTFDRSGLALGLARVLQRIWQVYWAHVGVFVTVLAMMAVAGTAPDGRPYLYGLNLQRFLADPAGLTAHFLTLTYVPNYFDILPMYLVILALMPAMIALERVDRRLPLAAAATIWLVDQTGHLNLPAEPWSDRPWFFDPFGWQLLFFLGFFLRRGTIRVPAASRWLTVAAVMVVVAAVPFSYFRILQAVPALAEAAEHLRPFTTKTHFGILRLVHFLALAWLAYALVPATSRLLAGGVATVVRKVGQQSLAVFVSGMVLAQALGILLDTTGRGAIAMAAVNGFGLALIVAVAFVVSWFKSSPWKA